MADESRQRSAAEAMRRIDRAWLEGRIEDLATMLRPDVVMVLPGFEGRVEGRDAFLAGFRDFCENATVHEFREHDRHVDVAGDTAVASFRYEIVYERSGERYRATGRDLWVLALEDGRWLAAWRTLLDVEESAA